MKTTAAFILASMATLVSAAPSLLRRDDDDNDSKNVTKIFLSDLPVGSSFYDNVANSTLGRRIHRKLPFSNQRSS